MASKMESLRETAIAVPTRPMKARAAKCPTNPGHQNTQIYKSTERVAYCKCNDCGETWKQPVEPSDDAEFLLRLAESLETSPTQTVDKVSAVVLPVSEVTPLVERLRTIAMR